MITTIRRIVTSKLGAGIALLLLVLMGLSFAMGDVRSLSMGGDTSVGAGNIAVVGGEHVSIVQVRRLLDAQYRQAQQQQPGLTKAQFVAGGALDQIVRQLTDMAAIRQYAEKLGIGIDTATIDGTIARTPAFANQMTGEFDQTTFEQVIAQQGMRPADVRNEVRTNALIRQLLAPYGVVESLPLGMATPYASMLLEQRFGQAAFIPSQRFAPTTPPTDAQLTSFYNAERARYSIPARRVIRYAVIDGNALPTTAAPTDAEIAADYQARSAEFAASETRRFSQVIAGTREQAAQIAAAANHGTLAAAARAAGLEAAPINATSASQLTTATSAEASQAGYAARTGAVLGPYRVPLGFLVLKLDAIDTRPARSLAEVTPTLRTEIGERKRREALAALYNGTQDALNRGATLDEIATDKHLTVLTTPAIMANGTAPEDASFRPNQVLQAVMRPAFGLNAGDPAQIVPVVENQIFAIFDVPRIVPAAPPPLASIRDRVVADWRLTEGSRAARTRARSIVTAVEGGQPFAAAVAAAGAAGSVQPIQGRRIGAEGQGRLPPEVALLFSMSPNGVKTLELPQNAGWMVIQLVRSVRGDASHDERLLGGVRQQLTQAVGGEYAEIIITAARQAFPITIDPAAVATLRQELMGGGASTAP